MEFTKEETEWLEQEKRRQIAPRIPHDMNVHAKTYSDLGLDFAWKQTEQDFTGYYDPKKIVRNLRWNPKDSTSEAFVEA